MTTMILEKQARFTIDAYKRIAELEAKLAAAKKKQAEDSDADAE